MNLKEIARKAGVSPSTVSMILNGKPGASDDTRRKVTDLLAQNGYQIHAESGTVKRIRVARGNIRFLKYTKHAHLVNGNAGFVSKIIDSVEEESRRMGYNLIMTTLDSGSVEQTLQMVSAEPLDGIIFMATEADGALAARLCEIGVPVVALDNPMEFVECSCVDMNNEEAAFTTVRHLVSLGHKEIGYFCNELPSCNCHARFEAYRRALAHFGLSFHEQFVVKAHPTLEGAFQDVSRALQNGLQLPTAMLSTNDTIALGAMNALTKWGLRVPEDISVIGFDDIIFAAASDPPLTTVNISCKAMGIWAVRLLCDQIRQTDFPVTKIMIGARLVQRGSTAPPAQTAIADRGQRISRRLP